MSTEQEYPPLEFPGWERGLYGGIPYFTRSLAGEVYVYAVGAYRPRRNGSAIMEIRGACYKRAVGDVLREVEQYILSIAYKKMLDATTAWEDLRGEVGQ